MMFGFDSLAAGGCADEDADRREPATRLSVRTGCSCRGSALNTIFYTGLRVLTTIRGA